MTEVMSVEEVAELLGIGRNSVYDAANRGEIPHRRVGRRLVFSRDAVLKWLAGDGDQETRTLVLQKTR